MIVYVGSTTMLIGPVVASLDKALYNDYLCLVALNNSVIRSKFSDKKSNKQLKNSEMVNF